MPPKPRAKKATPKASGKPDKVDQASSSEEEATLQQRKGSASSDDPNSTENESRGGSISDTTSDSVDEHPRKSRRREKSPREITRRHTRGHHNETRMRGRKSRRHRSNSSDSARSTSTTSTSPDEDAHVTKLAEGLRAGDGEEVTRALPFNWRRYDFTEVVEFYRMSGDVDYLLRVVASDAADYERIHRSRISRLPGIQRIQSSLALRTRGSNSVLRASWAMGWP